MKTVAVFTTRLEASIAQGALEANGIQAVLRADDEGGAAPYPMAMKIGVELQVDEKDIAHAKKILKLS